MPGNQLLFYGTTGTSGAADGGSQPNPALWLGRFRASQTLHSLLSTLTASQTTESRHYLVDSSQIGAGVQVHRLKWLVLLTGPAAGAAARVAAFDSATGVFKLDRRLPQSAASGNSYALFNRGNVFPDVSTTQARLGDTRYRCIVFRNQHAGALANVRIYFRDLGAVGGQDFARVHQANAAVLGSPPFLQRASDTLDVLSATGAIDPQGGPDQFRDAGGWRNPFGYGSAGELISSHPQNQNVAIWLRRRIPAGSSSRRSIAIQVVAESTTTGSDPSPLVGSCVIAYDVASEDPTLEIERDRWVALGGGARITATVRRAGAPQSGVRGRWALRPGDPGLLYTDDVPLADFATSDANGELAATYHAPSDPGFEGLDAAPRLILAAGDEVGDPQPRIALTSQTTFGFAVTADATLPQPLESFDEDPGAGFWPGE